MYALTGMTLKDICYMRLCYMIKRGQLTFSDVVANSTYTHQNLKYRVTIQNEFLEECSVVRFFKMQSGKKRLMNKKDMNRNLGKGRSMDVVDPCAMRMYPCVDMEYGTELQRGFEAAYEESDMDSDRRGKQSIFDETMWY